MFFTIKESNLSHREKRQRDAIESQSMEEELRIATERKRERDTAEASYVATPRTRIVTPGTRAPTGRREPGTPMIRSKRFGI